MYRKTLAAVCSAFILLGGTAIADNTVTSEQSVLFGVGIQGDIEGEKDSQFDNYPALMVQAGLRLNPNWTLFAQYTFANNIKINDTHKTTDVHRYAGLISYDFMPELNYSFYVMAGLGDEALPDLDERNGIFATYGLGFHFKIAQGFGLDLSGAAKHNLDHQDKAILVGAALTYHFKI